MSNIERADQASSSDVEAFPAATSETLTVTTEQAVHVISARIGTLADRVAVLPHKPWTSPHEQGVWEASTGVFRVATGENGGGEASISLLVRSGQPTEVEYTAKLTAPGRRGASIVGPYEFVVGVRDRNSGKAVKTTGEVEGDTATFSGEIEDRSNMPAERMPKTEPMDSRQAMRATTEVLDEIEAGVLGLEEQNRLPRPGQLPQ